MKFWQTNFLRHSVLYPVFHCYSSSDCWGLRFTLAADIVCLTKLRIDNDDVNDDELMIVIMITIINMIIRIIQDEFLTDVKFCEVVKMLLLINTRYFSGAF